MHQKDAIKEAWRAAGLYDSKDAKLQEFLHRLDTAPLECWPELIDEMRRNYPEYKRQVVEPIVNTGDKLLRLNLIRNADFTQPDELAMASEFLAGADPAKDHPELKALLLRDSPEITKRIQEVKQLPNDLKAMIEEPMRPAPKPPGAPGAKPKRGPRVRRGQPPVG